MARTPLVTVPDEGAAWIVRDALTAGGITVEVEPAGREHPYAGNALARAMRVWVPVEQLAEARRLLAALEADVSNDADLSAEAMAAGNAEGLEAAAPVAKKSGYWFLYNLTLIVVFMMSAINHLSEPEGEVGLGGLSLKTWAAINLGLMIWSALALALTHFLGRRSVRRTAVIDLVAAVVVAGGAWLVL
jgi:hypothetical protein